MEFDATAAASPEPLDLLIAALPGRVLLDLVKSEPQLSRTVFQGFASRVQSLSRPVVRQRLERELAKAPELTAILLQTWLQLYEDLMLQLNDADFSPTAESLQPLLAEYGEAPLRYGLLHAVREDVRDWADRIDEIREAVPYAIVRPAPAAEPVVDEAHATEIEALRAEIQELQRALREAERERDELRRETGRLTRQLDTAGDLETALRKLQQAAEERVEREHRRARKAEEEAEKLRKELRKAEREAATPAAKTPSGPAPILPQAAAVISEAIALLQQGLDLTVPPPAGREEAPPVIAPVSSPPAPTPAPAASAQQPKRPAGPSVSLAGARGKKTYPVVQVLMALVQNNVALVEEVRNGIARLGNAPQREREVLSQLEQAGIPAAVLTGPLRAAVVDGSNVANMSPERRARLSYLQQVQRSAWAEGYFPVYIIVDASLRHQIDQPDLLMDMIERGEIVMAPPGTSADELLIEEAGAHNAVLITNDRMADWPAAKTLQKRHVTLERGSVRIGSFHHAGRWFHW